MTENTIEQSKNEENSYLTDDTSELDYDDNDNISFSSPVHRGSFKKAPSEIGLSKNELNTMTAENNIDAVSITDLSLKQSFQLYFILEDLSSSASASENIPMTSPMELQHKVSKLLEQLEGKELSDVDEDNFRKSLLDHQQKANFDLADKVVYDLISQTIEREVKNTEIANQYFLMLIKLCHMLDSHATYLNIGEVIDDSYEDTVASIIKQDDEHNKESIPPKTNPHIIESVVRRDISDNNISQPGFDFSPLDIVFTKAYKAKLLQNLHGDSNVSCIKELKNKGLLLKFKPTSHNKSQSADIIDTGNSLCKLKTNESDPIESAKEMINILKVKGWNKITIQSTDNKEFENSLISLAKKSNIAVRVIKPESEKTSNSKEEKKPKSENSTLEKESVKEKNTPQASFSR